MREDVPSLFANDGIGKGLSVRSISGLFAASADKADFGERVARRMIGCLSTDSLCIVHGSGQLNLSQIGADMVTSGTRLGGNETTDWFIAEPQTLAGSRVYTIADEGT